MSQIRVNLLKPKVSPGPSRPWLPQGLYEYTLGWLIPLVIALVVLILATQNASAYNVGVINKLKGIQEKSTAALSGYDKELMQAYRDTTKISSQDVDSGTAEQSINFANEKIKSLLSEKIEQIQILKLMDKMIFAMADAKSNSDVKAGLLQVIDSMVMCEMQIGGQCTGNTLPDPAQIRFLINLSTALRTMTEPIEDGAAFLENYIQFSSISNPRSISDFRSSQGYLNEVKPRTQTPEAPVSTNVTN